LLEALDRISTVHFERLDAALAEAASDPRAQVAAFIDAHLGLAATADDRMLRCWIDMSGEALRHGEVASPFHMVLERLIDRLEAVIQEGNDTNVFDADARAASCALVSTIQGYLLLAGTSRDLIPRGTASRSTQAMAWGLLIGGS
jgi:hypothetical protein